MTLGKLIKSLEACQPTATVEFDFCGCVPTTLDSWRGIYSDLALGWAQPGYDTKAVEVEDLLKTLRHAIGKKYNGWKGGDYLMGEGTEVWVDNSGKYTNTSIIRVFEEYESSVIIETRRNG